ncbi:Vitamin K-dependent protein Z [Heterocephalus glaber]|uniref:Vitamin K-dependent protein Z n=1 Tax=Heterocephalus glaber TaxID=10181 RepID=G5AVW0_HETGA|nr:Vitamin K-dependent protein Z [Heterocephalus glaber]
MPVLTTWQDAQTGSVQRTSPMLSTGPGPKVTLSAQNVLVTVRVAPLAGVQAWWEEGEVLLLGVGAEGTQKTSKGWVGAVPTEGLCGKAPCGQQATAARAGLWTSDHLVLPGRAPISMAGCVLLLQGLALLLLFHQAELSVFVPATSANQVLLRWKRAGSYILEELFEGNLEKECYEEICVHEEAREVFEDDEATPCLNNGSCHDAIRSFTCTCSPGFEGRTCALATNKCHPERPDGCQHFCHPGQASYVCSCAQGHKLAKDRRSCAPHATNKCHPERPDGCQHFCHPGQASYVCSCAQGHKLAKDRRSCAPHGPAGPGEAPRMARVRRAHVHLRYDAELGQNDISLLELERPVHCPGWGLPVCIPERDFAEQVLVPGTGGVLSSWTINGTNLGDTLTTLPVTQVAGEECGQALNVTVTTRTCCERGSAAAGRWVPGSVVTREHEGTWFLTGLLGSSPLPQEQAAAVLVTKVSRYALWFRQTMKGPGLGQRAGHEVGLGVGMWRKPDPTAQLSREAALLDRR